VTSTEQGPKKVARKRAAAGARKRSQVKVKGAESKVVGTLGPLPGEPNPVDRRSKHPWHVIRVEYIEGIPNSEGSVDYPTLDALSKKWNITPSMVRTRSTEEQWGRRREAAQAAAAAQRRMDRQRELAGMSTDIDEKAIRLSQLGLGLVTTRMSEIAKDAAMRRAWQQQRDRMMEQGRLPDASDPGPPPMDSRELTTLAGAATTWHALGRQAIGDDVTHIEVSGPNGGPITTVSANLLTDDPDRLVDVVAAMQRSGVLDDIIASGHVVDGTVVSDVTEPPSERPQSPADALEALVGGAGTPEAFDAAEESLDLPREMVEDADPEVLAQRAADLDAEYDIEG
jgi:hypothetical protein